METIKKGTVVFEISNDSHDVKIVDPVEKSCCLNGPLPDFRGIRNELNNMEEGQTLTIKKIKLTKNLKLQDLD